MVFSNTCFNKELSLAVFVERENVLALVIRIGMSLFLCSDKSETSFFLLVTLWIVKYIIIIQAS